MLNAASLRHEIGTDFSCVMTDLLRSTLRTLILVTAGVYLMWYYVYALTWPERNSGPLFAAALVLLLTGALALKMLGRQLVVGHALWLAGLAVAIVLGLWATRQPELAFLFALLPLLAAVIGGWRAGVVMLVLGAGAVHWLWRSALIPQLAPGYLLAVIVCGGFGVLLGWAVTRGLLAAASWSTLSSLKTWRTMEELRERRMELLQVQEDLTHANRELARVSDRLKVMYQVAEEARRTKERFVANVSHELRTPLNMIIGFSEMITQSPQVYSTDLPPALLADIEAIQRNSQHLAKLVDDVLDLSQVDAGRMALTRERANVQDIIDEAVDAVRALFDSKGLFLESGRSAESLSVFCDATRMRQVVINLLSNAGRFTERGGVRVEALRDGQGVVVRVADTGPGIAPEDQDRIFQPFEQLGSSIRRQHGGSGLGLSISKRFVEMHGGKMWLESPSNLARNEGEGPGTAFFFTLPLDARAPIAVAEGTDARRWFNPYDGYEYRMRTRRSRASVPERVPRYVVLEQGDTLHGVLGRYASGADIVKVRDVEDALRELAVSPARALLVNASPFEDGRSWRQQLTGLPYGSLAIECWVPGAEEAARRLGVVQYLVKPVSRDALVASVDAVGRDVRSVLLVDDEPEVLQLFARMLVSSGRDYTILRAGSGRRALSLLRQRRPNLVLLDLVMPGMAGLQVLREKAQDPTIRDIPVIIVSSRDPGSEIAASDTLSVTRSEGFSVGDLLACIDAISEALAPGQPGDRGQREAPAA